MMTSATHTAKANMHPSLFERGKAIGNIKSKPLPPYGEEAALLMSWGAKPRGGIYMFAGINGLNKAKAFKNTQIVMCLPYGADPVNYSWPVCDCPVLLFDTGFLNITDIDKIAYCLLRDKAEIVRVWLSSNKLVIYRGAQHG